MALTIVDKGRWVVSGEGELRLNSDPVVVWTPEVDRQWIGVARKARPEEVALVSEGRLTYLEKHREMAADPLRVVALFLTS
ncbi:MAG: hypothetical protein MUF10_20250, partial [Thermoanaerobaculaceae bacterium]|nr:hypothetical protein [Thermoanaerobaculaceae bacterium]